ncbi:hypothetical protein [Methylobacterium isbiliense]|jgi:hypothetical protein|uniref:Uncharacterized protein n=1 Tax=Methylobacterium isbiliense TaxID=315478 RepID=A0ABQ4S8P4_9HYPH|nr:hypothetical protein [Methylobacterium isbiliense]MDN3624976.1 hypothetical protein [Methylobacterium isbiliense]GJD98854.1 hypothetical protein GMJLKIPL_0767 [Methylobacterium isbiliense]
MPKRSLIPPCRLVSAAILLGAVWAAPAAAQSRPGWTDPPVRTAPPEPPSQSPRADTPKTATPKAAAPKVEAPARPAPAVAARPARVRTEAARRRPAPVARAVSKARPAIAATARPVRHPVVRTAAVRPRPVRLQTPRPAAYDGGWEVWEADRMERIRRAQAAGYLVMRRSTWESMTGRSGHDPARGWFRESDEE